jgi:hypothetical protein
MSIVGIEAFQTAATTLGLRLEAPNLSWWRSYNLAILEGTVDGTRVVVQQGVEGSVSPVMRVYFHAALDPALDLGLRISLRGSYFSHTTPLGERDAVGGPAFDAAFAMQATEPGRLAALLTPALRRALVGFHNARRWERDSAAKNALDFWITDESVILRIETNALGYGGTKAIAVEELLTDIRATAGLAKTLGDAMAHVPPSAALAQHAPAWRAFADANGLAFSASPLRVSGSFAGVAFAARAALVDGALGVELTMPFARPLPFYLRLGPRCGWFEVPRSYTDAWAEWVRPQKTGDDVFDKALEVVSAVDTDALTAVLNPEVRGALLVLRSRHDHVEMSTTSVSVRTRGLVGPDAFAEILRPLAELEKTIERGAPR